MAKESQESKETPEPQDDKFINEFSSILNVGVLRDYEKKNRDKIAESSFMVRDAFDKLWKKITNSYYYQPVTEIASAPAKSLERTDPRSKRYRANVVFKEIEWNKIRRKIGRKITDLYILHGVPIGSDVRRPIFQNLNANRMKEILGEKNAGRIMNVKGAVDGKISGNFDLEVEGYWEVQFAPMKDPNDPKDVRLTWEGQCLIMKRMVPVVLPGFYLEVADNALRDAYTQSPEQGRKKVGTIQEFPYTVFREATMEEYILQKSEGDRISRAARARQEEGN